MLLTRFALRPATMTIGDRNLEVPSVESIALNLLVLSMEWESGNGISINGYYGSFSHSILSTSK